MNYEWIGLLHFYTRPSIYYDLIRNTNFNDVNVYRWGKRVRIKAADENKSE